MRTYTQPCRPGSFVCLPGRGSWELWWGTQSERNRLPSLCRVACAADVPSNAYFRPQGNPVPLHGLRFRPRVALDPTDAPPRRRFPGRSSWCRPSPHPWNCSPTKGEAAPKGNGPKTNDNPDVPSGTAFSLLNDRAADRHGSWVSRSSSHI